MRVTYYALKPLQVGDTLREPGDLVPEAAEWAFLPGYVADGKIAPVLVATLPQKSQEVLAKWESDRDQAANPPVAQTQTPGDGTPAAAKPKSKVVA